MQGGRKRVTSEMERNKIYVRRISKRERLLGEKLKRRGKERIAQDRDGRGRRRRARWRSRSHENND